MLATSSAPFAFVCIMKVIACRKVKMAKSITDLRRFLACLAE